MALIGIIIASLLVGFGGGWVIKGWEDSAELAMVKSDNNKLSDRNSYLVNANDRCKVDIESVKASAKEIAKAAAGREEAAKVAMSQAEVLAAKHSRTAVMIKAAPNVPENEQCNAIVKEQIKYVENRRTDS
jgi:hypothetical protein